jgi:hypothetical protein
MTDTKENTNRYSFQSEFVNNNSNNNNNNNSNNNNGNHTDPVVTWDVIVVLGNQQVVAGMNYHLTMVVVVTRRNDNNENETDTNQTNTSSSSSSSEHIRARQPEVATQVVVGGFDVVVYDQFGTLSITRWGKELSIQKAQELWTNYFNNMNHHQPDEEKANVKVDVDTDMTNTNAILDSEGK